MATSVTAPAAGQPDFRETVLNRYDQKIAYYWKSSRSNKRSYKLTRFLLIILGAIVTLVASLSAAGSIKGWPATALAVLTPLLAASMAIVSGISQAFQWGAAWSDMVMTASRLEKERDRIAVAPLESLDPVKELAVLDDLVIAETQGFFQRLFGAGGPTQGNSPAPQP